VLRRLRLEEFLLLPEVEVGFEPGLNAVTGETGTGKSILIDAIGFLVGGRADSTWIRSGSEALQVVGEFSIDRLPEAGAAAAAIGVAPSKDGGIEIRRELTLRGRSKAWVQGKSVRVHELRLLGEQLLEIHAQGEHRRLLDPATQLALVDRMAAALPLREAYARARARWIETEAELRATRSRHAVLVEKEDWLRAQLGEIEAAGIASGEEDRLRERVIQGRARRAGIEAQSEIARLLFDEEGSAAERIESALHRSSGLPEGWAELRAALDAARDALRNARRCLPTEGESEADLDEAEDRLREIGRLKKKYGGTEEAIGARAGDLRALLEEIETLAVRLPRLERENDEHRTAASEAALRLRAARQGVAPGLARAVAAELRELGMSGARLEVVLREEEAGPDEGLPVEGRLVRAFADGIDRGWLELAPNPGEGAGPIGEVASGGELSRCLLALLTILGGREEPRTAIFDEVDAGVGGATARALARRLERLAEDRQVLLVTHLPVVACRASRHIRVEKATRGGRTNARIVPLNREERIGELARMLAGEVDSTIARRHAEALLAESFPMKEPG
jgi:DNA repair protein RecN (Recombination protein N)